MIGTLLAATALAAPTHGCVRRNTGTNGPTQSGTESAFLAARDAVMRFFEGQFPKFFDDVLLPRTKHLYVAVIGDSLKDGVDSTGYLKKFRFDILRKNIIQESDRGRELSSKWGPGGLISQRAEQVKFVGEPTFLGKGVDTVVTRVTLSTGESWALRDSSISRNRETLRKTWAAAKLNETLGLTTVARAKRIVTPEGSFGVISRIVPGEPPRGRYNFEPDAFMKGLDPASSSEAQAFEFLIGNSDIHGDNFHIWDANGARKPVVFDHGRAFSPSLVPPRTINDYPDAETVVRIATLRFGAEPPERYTRRFIESIQRLDEKSLTDDLGDSLTPTEISAILFRRQVILKHVELMGQQAYLP